MTIAIDFDGTCVTHEYPRLGRDIGAVPVLQELVNNGHQLILFTMRSDISEAEKNNGEMLIGAGNYLTDAINWFKRNNIPLYGIQKNPTQNTWTTSPKAYADLYIDDSALGCPLTMSLEEPRAFVDWVKVREMLKKSGIIK
jgi:hypothetical protein